MTLLNLQVYLERRGVDRFCLHVHARRISLTARVGDRLFATHGHAVLDAAVGALLNRIDEAARV